MRDRASEYLDVTRFSYDETFQRQLTGRQSRRRTSIRSDGTSLDSLRLPDPANRTAATDFDQLNRELEINRDPPSTMKEWQHSQAQL